MFFETKFNLGIAISLLITGIFVLILSIFEFVTFIKCNKFLIFKKQKIFNMGWSINIIVLLIAISITVLLFVLDTPQAKYLPYAVVWLVIACISLSFSITRSVLIIKSKKGKYEIKNILSLKIEELAKKFKIKNFRDVINNTKLSKKNTWYKNLKENFDFLTNKIINLNKDNLTNTITEVITFEEISCSTIFSHRNKYAFCLFLTLLDSLQKKLKA